MAASPKNWRDKAWFGWFVIQIVVIFRMSPAHVCLAIPPLTRRT